MKFHIVTNVWGDGHTRQFLRATLPNLLSQGNLPALQKHGQVLYRFFTTPEARRLIEASPLYGDLAKICRIEFLTPLGEKEPAVIWHVHWFHRAAAEAKLAGAAAIFVPPDTLWGDGSFAAMAQRLGEGYAGVACPFVLTVGETLLPEVEGFRNDNALDIGGADLVRLALRHIHPLHVLAMQGAPHARPVFEMHWPVDSTTLLSRYAVRELVAFDPRRCPLTFLWYAGGPENLEALYFAADSDEMLMLSVDPISKYMQNYILEHGAAPLDMARTTLHPLNNTKQTKVFIRRPVRLHGGKPVSGAERRRHAQATLDAIEMETGRRALQIVQGLAANGAQRLSELLALAVFETPLLRRWRHDEPLGVAAFRDEVWDARFRHLADQLAHPGNEPALLGFIRALVRPNSPARPSRPRPSETPAIAWGDDGQPRWAGEAPAHRFTIEGTTVWVF